MSMNRSFRARSLLLIAAGSLGALGPTAARTQVVAPSMYTTAIQVQGEEAGAEFADWASSGIPIVDMDPADNPGGSPPFIDIANVQIANDDQFIYIHATTHGGTTSLANLFLAFDTDQNPATGFDVFQVGLLGSEFGYQTDFPFAQASGVFNTGAAITGGPVGNGGALIYPFWTEAGAPQGTEIEWAVPLDAFITLPAAPAFPNNSFDMVIYTTDGLGDISQVISYTLAEPPEGLPGDYNDNGTVDAADYTVWRDTLGSTTDLRANGDNTGGSENVIDQADYDVWASQFGAGVGNSAVSTAVPEPGTIRLLALAAVMIGIAWPRRRSLSRSET